MASLDIVDTPAQAAEQELPPLIVRDPLEAFLDEHGLGSARSRPSASARATRTSPTSCAAAGTASCFGARRDRAATVRHDVLREARLLAAVEGRIRTPRVLAASDDESILGVPFYVMEFMHGTVITHTIPPAIDNPEGARRSPTS